MHGTEIPYLFDTNLYIWPWLKTAADRRVQANFTRIFANFIKYGNPNDPNDKSYNLNWTPIDSEYPQRHLEVSDPPVMHDNVDHASRYDHLASLFESIGRDQ